MKTTEDIKPVFAKGEKAPANYFTGTAYLNILVSKDETGTFAVSSVSFERGARTNWHTHPAGQILLVTEGHGFYQEKGKPARAITKGEVVVIPTDVEHWHGARRDSAFSHIAISNFKENVSVVWLDPVSEEEYKNCHS